MVEDYEATSESLLIANSNLKGMEHFEDPSILQTQY